MARTTWKGVERDAAALVGAKRFWANAGSRLDVDSPHFAVQVKNPKTMALAELERLLDEMTLIGLDEGKIPLVVIKRSAKRPTPLMVLMTAEAFDFMRTTLIVQLDADGYGDGFTKWCKTAVTKLKERPGMRAQVAEYVTKSKSRGKKR